MNDPTRRQLLKAVVGLTGTAAASSLCSGCLPDVSAARQIRLTPTRDGYYDLDLTQAPELQSSGGSVILAGHREIPTVLVLNDGGPYVALSGTCTHAGCPVGFTNGSVVCPCHLSAFDLQGHVTHPPATKPLRTFPTPEVANGRLRVFLLAGDGTFPTPQNGVMVLPFDQYPALRQRGGSVLGTPAGVMTPVFVLALADGSYSTVSSICTHAQCGLTFQSDQSDLYCDCHGSRFAGDGTVLEGPAEVPLARYATTADANGVTVTIA